MNKHTRKTKQKPSLTQTHRHWFPEEKDGREEVKKGKGGQIW